MKNSIISLFNTYALIISLALLAGLTSCQKEAIEHIATQEKIHICQSKTHTTHAPRATSRSTATRSRLWSVGQTITVHFIGGTPYLQAQVEKYAKEWEQDANIHFDFVNNPQADIRIAFEEGGSWSYLGTDALSIPFAEPTMNYGWLTNDTEEEEFARVILHEFGHALGLKHEHKHYDSDIEWDTEVVYDHLMNAPHNWTKEEIDHNLLNTYGIFTTQFCKYDPISIMHYSIPNIFTVNDFEVGDNTQLSDADKFFIGQLYPFEGNRARQVKCE